MNPGLTEFRGAAAALQRLAEVRDDRRTRMFPDLLDRTTGGELNQPEARGRDVEHADVDDHEVDAALADQRKSALVDELRLPVAADVLGEDDDPTCPVTKSMAPPIPRTRCPGT